MVSSAITPTRTIAVLIGVAVIAVAGFAVVRSGVFEPETVQGAIPGPGSSSPSASASESPSAPPPAVVSPKPTTPAQIKAKNIADAKARLVEYYETTAQVANNGYEDWERQLRPFWVRPDLWGPLAQTYSGFADTGQYTVGSANIVSIRVVDYADSAEGGFEQVSFDACVDFSEVLTFDKSGNEISREAGAPERYRFDYVMAHQGLNSVWTVDEQVPHPEQAC
jgi:hypothetical protein